MTRGFPKTGSLRDVESEVDRRMRRLLATIDQHRRSDLVIMRHAQLFGVSLAEAIEHFKPIRAGRSSGNQENTMSTKFKFPLGALVVLTTSFVFAAKQTEEADREVHLAAERQASRAKDEAYRVAGRSDLIESQGYSPEEKANFALTTLVAMDPPIEAGKVIARSEYLEHGVPPQYMVRYRAGDGRQTEAWFSDASIEFDPRYPEHLNIAGKASERTAEDVRHHNV